MKQTALRRYCGFARYEWSDNTAHMLVIAGRCRQFRHCNARLYERMGYILLVSYDTPVAIAHEGKVYMVNPRNYSRTTTRQIRWFLQDICGISNP